MFILFFTNLTYYNENKDYILLKNIFLICNRNLKSFMFFFINLKFYKKLNKTSLGLYIFVGDLHFKDVKYKILSLT